MTPSSTARPARSVYILRHGIRQDFITTDFVSPTGRKHDPPLHETGHQQAEALAVFLGQSQTSKIRHVFCSPFSRCVQTVRPLSLALGVPLRIEPGVGEWFKVINVGTDLFDKDSEPPSLNELATALNIKTGSCAGEIDPAYEPVAVRVKRETPDEIHTRFERVLNELVDRLDKEQLDGDVLIATHAAGLIAAVRGLLQWPNAPVVAGVATFTKLSRSADPPAPGERVWKVDINGEQSHLAQHGGLLYNWQFPGAFAPVGSYNDIFTPPPLDS
ncbi:UNVERIFIED_CONTAM: hypothetical protein HDU68_002771 [Siphonaria sp. JEL0065]|nr:hypothetical protein HDU68_002771 [Siphonaria sp. JEL0065]